MICPFLVMQKAVSSLNPAALGGVLQNPIGHNRAGDKMRNDSEF
jgi:hypothetical protein